MSLLGPLEHPEERKQSVLQPKFIQMDIAVYTVYALQSLWVVGSAQAFILLGSGIQVGLSLNPHERGSGSTSWHLQGYPILRCCKLSVQGQALGSARRKDGRREVGKKGGRRETIHEIMELFSSQTEQLIEVAQLWIHLSATTMLGEPSPVCSTSPSVFPCPNVTHPSRHSSMTQEEATFHPPLQELPPAHLATPLKDQRSLISKSIASGVKKKCCSSHLLGILFSSTAFRGFC